MKDGRTGRVLASLLLAAAAAAALASLPWPNVPRHAAVSDGFEITAAEIEASAVQLQRLERRLWEHWTVVAAAAGALASRPRMAHGHPMQSDGEQGDPSGAPGASGFATATAERRTVRQHGAERADKPAE